MTSEFREHYTLDENNEGILIIADGPEKRIKEIEALAYSYQPNIYVLFKEEPQTVVVIKHGTIHVENSKGHESNFAFQEGSSPVIVWGRDRYNRRIRAVFQFESGQIETSPDLPPPAA